MSKQIGFAPNLVWQLRCLCWSSSTGWAILLVALTHWLSLRFAFLCAGVGAGGETA